MEWREKGGELRVGWSLQVSPLIPVPALLMRLRNQVGIRNVNVTVLLAGLVAVGEKAQKRSGHYVVMKDLSGEILV